MKRNTKFSIKAKLLTAIIPITSAMIIALVIIAYNVSASMIRQNAESLLETSVAKQTAGIEAWMTENLNSFGSAKKAIEEAHPDAKTLQKMVNGYYNFNTNSPDGLYIADQSGKVIKAGKSEALVESEIRLEGDAMRGGRVNDALVELQHSLAYRPAGLHALGDLGEIGVKADA